MTTMGKKIIALRKKGFSYRKIMDRLGVSSGNVSYYCTKGNWGRKSRKTSGLNGLSTFWAKTEDMIDRAKQIQKLILDLHKALS